MSIPVLVIGGGPGGSYAAAALAREGVDVVVLEAAKFPRYHIGESMLPSLRPFLKFIDAEQKIIDHGFCGKPGAAVKFNRWKREAYTDFIAMDKNNGAWNVVRSEFDDILLKHAGTVGAKVFEETKVTSIEFAPPSPPPSPPNPKKLPGARPTSVHYTNAAGVSGTTTFDYLVDASGRNGIMSTKYLQNRKMNASLKNVACWGYWTGGGVYMPGTTRQNAPFFQALTDESGWAWFIPLHDGTTSVGVIETQELSTAKKRKASEEAAKEGRTRSLQDHYLEQLQSFAPDLMVFLKDATLIAKDGDTNFVRSASDYSYAASSYAGDHFRIVGDAAAFIDPFFSSGLHLALTGALSAAASICAALRGDCTELDAAQYHDQKVGVSYTRFLLVVMSAYQQIRNQNAPVLSDIDEDNFDRAFDIIRPVIQGAADVGKRLTENELIKTMDFVQHIFSPTDPDMHTAVGARVEPEMFSPHGPVMTPDQIDEAVAGDEEAKAVLKEVNARKPIHIMYTGTANFELEGIAGYKVRCEKGSLGLQKA